MPFRIVTRKSTGALTIEGKNPITGARIQRRARSDNSKLAAEEAASWEASLLRSAWHGERLGARTFAAAVTSYVEAKPRSNDTLKRLNRLLQAVGNVTLAEIDQSTVAELRKKMLWAGAGDAAAMRGIVIPLRAVLRHAARQKWCDYPAFETAAKAEGRTEYVVPDEAERIIAAATPHLQPFLITAIGTGMRVSESLYVDWHDVNLTDAVIKLYPARTKSKKRRDVKLPPRVVAALTNLPHREGAVFRRPDGEPYCPKDGEGGQTKRAWQGALRRAGITRHLTLHEFGRHSWATWHYAQHRDLLMLKHDGGWSSVELVERYAHLCPSSYLPAIRRFLGLCDEAVTDAEHKAIIA
jgi:integrase